MNSENLLGQDWLFAAEKYSPIITKSCNWKLVSKSS